MRALIIDDEENAQVILKSMLATHCPKLNVVGIADSVATGLKAIEQLKPDVVFLDIELNAGSGFEILEKTGTIDFKIIFTTAFNQYALKAIKHAALDYLLKPIDIDELIAAVAKLEHKRKDSGLEGIQALLAIIKSKQPRKISLSSAEEVLYIAISDIIRCEADGGYTHFHLLNNKKITIPKTLGEYEELLYPDGFIRVHHSHLVNLAHVQKFLKPQDVLLMSDGTSVSVASRKKTEVLDKLSHFNNGH